MLVPLLDAELADLPTCERIEELGEERDEALAAGDKKKASQLEDEAGLALSVLTADCQPVLMADREAGVVGAVLDPYSHRRLVVVTAAVGLTAMALVLELLTQRDQKLSQIIASYPRYHIHKEKVALDRDGVTAAMQRLRASDWTANATVDTADGIKLVITLGRR